MPQRTLTIAEERPTPDGDAKGHLGIAAALLSDPLNVAAHWVWPPGYHYFLAALLAAGVTAQGVRLLDCALAALLPVLLWSYGERTIEPSASSPARLASFQPPVALMCRLVEAWLPARATTKS